MADPLEDALAAADPERLRVLAEECGEDLALVQELATISVDVTLARRRIEDFVAKLRRARLSVM